jgi:polysaccharide export outer membrane protein
MLLLCPKFLIRVQAPTMTPVSHSVESLPIAGGDLLHISVFDVPELDQHTRVSDAGDVKLSLLGTVRVAGMTPAEAALRIAQNYQRGGYIRKPQVSILVEEYAVANVSVMGQVLHPGNYPLSTPRDLMDVLSMAGGLTSTADIHITVKRLGHSGSPGETVYATIPNDPDAAILNSVKVAPGDLVIVPKAGIVYVLGDVNRPGGYVMQNDAQLTALQAIALASGMTKTSSENHARLVRQTPSGPIELPLALNAMQKGKQPDLLLQAQDVVYVPYSTARNLMLGASAILSSASGAAIYAAH